MLKFRGGGGDLGAEAKGRGAPAGRVPAKGRRGRQSGTATTKDENIFTNHPKFSIFAKCAASQPIPQEAAY